MLQLIECLCIIYYPEGFDRRQQVKLKLWKGEYPEKQAEIYEVWRHFPCLFTWIVWGRELRLGFG